MDCGGLGDVLFQHLVHWLAHRQRCRHLHPGVRRNSEAEEVVLAKEIRGGPDVFEIAGVPKFGRMKRLIFGPVDDFPQRSPARLQQRFVFASGEQNPAKAEVGLAAKGFVARVVDEHKQAIKRRTKWLRRRH